MGLLQAQPKPGYCHFYIQHKKRFCKFESHERGNNLCVFHSQDAGRVPCPLDPNHTIESDHVREHLLKCPSRARDVLPIWYRHNHNYSLPLPEAHAETEKFNIRHVDRSKLLRVIDIASGMTRDQVIRQDISSHEIMQDRINLLTQTRHAEQQSSLIGLLRDRNMLKTTDLFIEWGAGRAELSRYINKSLYHPSISQDTMSRGFLLIDRDGGKLKHDSRIVKDCVSHGTHETVVVREKVDIAHISNLDDLIATCFPMVDPRSICSVSKHLCGAATDLALSSLLSDQCSFSRRHTGFVLALCCHHRCDWAALMPRAREALSARGVDAEGFEILKGLSAYYTNGLRPGMDPESQGRHWSGFTHAQREQVGWQCKRTIDLVRLEAVKEAIGNNFRVELVKYIDECYSKECVAIIAHRV